MRGIVSKAVHLANSGNVIVDLWSLDGDGLILTAAGHVQSGDATYWVTLAPDGDTCTCEYAKHRFTEHSHTLALLYAASQEARNNE